MAPESRDWRERPAMPYVREQLSILQEWGMIHGDLDLSIVTQGEAEKLQQRVIANPKAIMAKFASGTLVTFPSSTEIHELSHYVIDRYGRLNQIFFRAPDGALVRKTLGSLLTMKVVGNEPVVTKRRRELEQRIAHCVGPLVDKKYSEKRGVEDLTVMKLRISLKVFRVLLQKPDVQEEELVNIVEKELKQSSGHEEESDGIHGQ